MLNRDTIYEISKYLTRQELFLFLNLCRELKQFEQVFFDKYFVCQPDEISFYPKARKLKIMDDLTDYMHLLNCSDMRFKKGYHAYIDNLPLCLQRLELAGQINLNIDINKMPDKVGILILSEYFNQFVIKWPERLRTLVIGKYYNHPLINLPMTLNKLILNGRFNHPLDDLPCRLTHLTLSRDFNYPIDYLPKDLIFLRAGRNFDQSIDNLPAGLRYLYLGNSFNRPLDKLPRFLSSLRLNGRLEYPIDNLPETIKCLILPDILNITAVNKWPSELRELRLGPDYIQYLKYLPDGLRILTVPFLSQLIVNHIKPSLRIIVTKPIIGSQSHTRFVSAILTKNPTIYIDYSFQ